MKRTKRAAYSSVGALVTAYWEGEVRRNTGRLMRDCSCNQPDSREGQVGRDRMAERLVAPRKSGNIDGGNVPQFKILPAINGKGVEIGQPANFRKHPQTADGAPPNEGRSNCGRTEPETER